MKQKGTEHARKMEKEEQGIERVSKVPEKELKMALF